MKVIQLTKGKVTIVDDQDYESVSRYKWHASYDLCTKGYYAVTNIRLSDIKPYRYRRCKIHRLIMGDPKGMQIDHKNHDTLDNRRSNLRICTKSQNMANSRKVKKLTSIYKGVWFVKDAKKWASAIRYNNKQHHLGYFADEKSAAKAYNNAALVHQKEFAFLNKI